MSGPIALKYTGFNNIVLAGWKNDFFLSNQHRPNNGEEWHTRQQ